MLKLNFKNTFLALSLFSIQSLAAGFLQIEGIVSDASVVGKAKAVRCEIQLYSQGKGIKKDGCDYNNPFILELNQNYALPDGTYIVGYENSIYPGLVEVRENQTTHLTLNEVEIGSEFTGQSVKMYRDFAHPIEQKKIMMTHFGLGRSFFLMTENEEEFQLRIPFFKEVLAQIDYKGCELVMSRAAKESTFRVERQDSIRICHSVVNAMTMLDFREVFDFNEDGSFVEMWVNRVGDLYKFKHKKHLVSQTLQAGDKVYLFSGAYKLSTDGKKSISVIVGDVEEARFGIESLAAAPQVISQNQENFSIVDGFEVEEFKAPGACHAQTVLWKTESRAYCRADSQAGCSRVAAKSCIDMQTQKITERD